jgi:hypothetical protein
MMWVLIRPDVIVGGSLPTFHGIESCVAILIAHRMDAPGLRRIAPCVFGRLGVVAEANAAQKETRMRLFRRARDTKTSVIRREAVSATAEAASVQPRPEPPASLPLSPVAPIVVEPTLRKESATAENVPPAPSSYDGLEDSDVFLCNRAAAPAPVEATEVTLFVHGWHNVEPGLLSWTFPSLRAALDAVKRMKNAIAWCVVSGTGWTDLDSARANGAILVEQLA